MVAVPPGELAKTIQSGLLSFPVTVFTDDLEIDETRYREHLSWQAEHRIAGLFAAGGTGEGFSLTTEEIVRVVRIAVDQVGRTVPVIASATGNTRQAIALARAAEDAGAHGILLLPPYLTESGQAGLAAHVSSVCAATNLGVILYNRANAIYRDDTVAALAERHPNLVGFKDGVGNVEALVKLVARLGDRLSYIGGLPTAETFALPLLTLGMNTYSSAMFNFIPEYALSFYDAVRAQDRAGVYQRINDFVAPYLDIRDRVPGYGVSIIKAGLTTVGRHGGPVRPPLQNLTEEEVNELAMLVNKIS